MKYIALTLIDKYVLYDKVIIIIIDTKLTVFY